MPRKSPSKDIDILGNLDIVPEKFAAEYLVSKEAKKQLLQPPNDDPAGYDIDTFYIFERLEHARLTALFKDMQEHRKQQELVSLQRAKKMSKDIGKLRNRFASANFFIRDFDEKRKNALRKIKKEMEEQSKIREDIDSRIEKFDELKIFRKKLLDTTKEYAIYESVLQDAIKITSCRSIEALISRCNAMMLAQNHMQEMIAESANQVEDMHKRMKEVTKHIGASISALMYELRENSRYYNKAKQESFRWEQILSKTQNTVVGKNLEKELVRDGIEQIYRMLCRKKGEPFTLTRVQVDKTLDFIKNEVELMRDVVDEYHNPTR